MRDAARNIWFSSFLLLPLGFSALGQDKSSSRAGLLKAPDASGTIRAESGLLENVGNMGDASFSLPLPSLPRRAGFGPDLHIGYSQQDTDQGLGMGAGWALSVPSITASHEHGVPLGGNMADGNLNAPLLMDGEKLIYMGSSGTQLNFRLRSSDSDIRIVYHPGPYVVPHARPIVDPVSFGEIQALIPSGFEVILPDGTRRLFTGDLAQAEGVDQTIGRLVTRYPLSFEVAPTGETISYHYIKALGRSYLSEVFFAGGKSRYRFDMMPASASMASYRMGFFQQNAMLYTRVVAAFDQKVQKQWCLAYQGWDDAEGEVKVKAHEACIKKARNDLKEERRVDVTTRQDQLRLIYRFGSDAELQATTLQEPLIRLGYSLSLPGTNDGIVATQPLDNLLPQGQFSAKTFELADFNHDGWVDAVHSKGPGDIQVFENQGDIQNLFKDGEPWFIQNNGRLEAPDLNSPAWHLTDLNGDTLVDLLHWKENVAVIHLGKPGGGFEPSGSSTLVDSGQLNANSFIDGASQFVDLDNDGRSDILGLTRDASNRTQWTYALNRSWWNGQEWVFSFLPRQRSFAFPDRLMTLASSNFRVTDANGDGLPDIAWFIPSNQDQSRGLCLYMNQGRPYANDGSLLFDAGVSDDVCGQGGKFISLSALPGALSLDDLWLADFNGDGLSDISRLSSDRQTIRVLLAQGHMKWSAQPMVMKLELPDGFQLTANSRTRISDLDGDGVAEIFVLDASEGRSRAFLIDFNRQDGAQEPKPNLLTQVEFGSGQRYDILYTTSTNERRRDIRQQKEAGAIQPTHLHYPVYLVKQIISSLGKPGAAHSQVDVQEFFYTGPRFSAEDRRFLGYTEVGTLNYGDRYAQESSYTLNTYMTSSQNISSRRLAGKPMSTRTYRVLNDPFFEAECQRNLSFDPDARFAHSRLEGSTEERLPPLGLPLRETTWKWSTQDVDGTGRAYFLQLNSVDDWAFPSQALISAGMGRTTTRYEDYDRHNFPERMITEVHAVRAPDGSSLPAYSTEIQYDYTNSRNTLQDKGILDKPDSIITMRNEEPVSLEEYTYDDLLRGLVMKITTTFFSRYLEAFPVLEDRRAAALERRSIFDYDSHGNPIHESDEVGIIEERKYDDDGIFPVRRTIPAGDKSLVTTFQYEDGHLLKVVDPRGLETHYEYDSLERFTRVHRSDGSENRFAYKPAQDGHPEFLLQKSRRQAALPNGQDADHHWHMKLDAYHIDGQLLASLVNTTDDGVPKVRVTNYRQFNRMRQEVFTGTPYLLSEIPDLAKPDVAGIFAQLNTIPAPTMKSGKTTLYDPLGRVHREELPSNLVTTYSYQPWGYQIEREYPRDQQEARDTETWVGHAIGIFSHIKTDPKTGTKHTTTFKRDPLGHLASVQLPGQTEARELVYNSAGELEFQNIPGLGRRFDLHDTRGRLTAQIRVSEDGKQTDVVEAVYDAQDRLLKEIQNQKTRVENTYDVYPKDWQEVPRYQARLKDPIGLLTEAKTYDIAHGLHPQVDRLAYNQSGQLLLRATRIGEQNFAQHYQYNLDGSRQELQDDLGFTQRFVYGNHADLSRIELSLGEDRPFVSGIDSISYNGRGGIKKLVYQKSSEDSLATAFTYDPETLALQRMQTSLRQQGKIRVLQDLELVLDGLQFVTAIKDTSDAATAKTLDRSARFQFNWKNELVQAERFGKTWGYTYHPDGSFATKDEGQGERAFAAQPSFQLIDSKDPHRYDGFGQLVQSAPFKDLAYDASGRLIRLETSNGTVVRFGYDAMGQRSYRQVVDSASGKTKTWYSPWPALLQSSEGRETYVYLEGSRIIRYLAGSEDWQYLLQDHLGSTDYLVDRQGKTVESIAYDPYGLESQGNPSGINRTAPRYTGHVSDLESGLVYMGHRYYAPQLGRFITPDPLYINNPEACEKKPAECNLYIYAFNNPINFTDPTGLGGGPSKAAAGPPIHGPRLQQRRGAITAHDYARQVRASLRTQVVANGPPRRFSLRDLPHVNLSNGRRNCINCSLALDFSMAGLPTFAGVGTDTPIAAPSVEAIYIGRRFSDPLTAQELTDRIQGEGNGARGIVFAIARTVQNGNQPPNHFFNIRNVNGTAQTLDAQTGQIDFGLGRYEAFYFLRTN